MPVPTGWATAMPGRVRAGDGMEWMVWIGAAVSLGGIAGLLRCIQLAMRARRAGLDDAAMRARLQQIVTLNLAALGVSALGLMLVVVGILLR